jgi:hypothetical protein
VLEFYRVLSLTFGFLGVSLSGKLGLTRSLRRALSVLSMARRSFALLLEPPRLAEGHPVDSRGDHDDGDDEYDHQWIVHKGPPFLDRPFPTPIGPLSPPPNLLGFNPG